MYKIKLFMNVRYGEQNQWMSRITQLPAIPTLKTTAIYLRNEIGFEEFTVDIGYGYPIWMREDDPLIYIQIFSADLDDKSGVGPQSLEEWVVSYKSSGWQECKEPRPWRKEL
jgi:hypothetical protein